VSTPARHASECPHRPPCPGCPRFGEPGLPGPALEALGAFARTHALPSVPVVAGARTGFRHRARLAIRGRRGAPKIGLFQLGSHRVVTIPNCIVQHPLINHVARVVRGALIDAGTTCYSDEANQGLARYLQVVVERRSGTAQVVLVANSLDPGPLAPCLDLIRERLGDRLHSLWFNSNVARTNAIPGRDFVRWCGRETVVERFGGAAIHYPPGAFGQNNLDVAERIVDHVAGLVPQGSRVAEFYAGVGAIGLSLLERVSQLRLNEVGAQSLQGLALGLAGLDPDARARVQVFPGPAGEQAAIAADVEIVIADPPRKGLDAALFDALCSRAPARFVYVSCGLASFLADAERLTSRGAMRLRGVHAFDLMPYTDHVETVAWFERP
jgi:23S rRNA (uracil1939-C5)-methyltransferase